MKRILTAVLVIAFAVTYPHATEYMMWYDQPGTGNWKTAHLPIGNSLFGAGLMGGVAVDSMFLNDNSAFDVVNASKPWMHGFAWMKVTVDGTDGFTDFRRDLDLGEATGHVTYTAGGNDWQREYFCSLPDTVMICRYTCSAPGQLNLTIKIVPNAAIHTPAVTAAGCVITYTGSLPVQDWGAWQFNARTHVRNSGGSVAVTADTAISVTGADTVDIFFTIANNFELSYADGFRNDDDLASVSTARINAALTKPYADLLADHMVDFQNIFNRFSLDLGTDINTTIPTDERLQNSLPGIFNDPGLEVLWMQFYRYIIISCSRSQLPAGLQGMWGANENFYSGGGYYINQNFQMNYWGAEALNVQETMDPVITMWHEALNTSIRGDGTIIADGGSTGPYSFFGYDEGNFAWMMQTLYEHYRFNPSEGLLADTLWPLLAGGSKYYVKHMTEEMDGKKSMINIISPENHYLCDPVTDEFIRDGNNQRITFRDTTAAFVQQCAVSLLTNTVEAAAILDIEPDLKLECETLLAEMDSGLWISPTDGRLQEFWHDTLVGQRYHRHCSHLLAVWPFDQVSPIVDTMYAKAAEKSVIQRGINFGPDKSPYRGLFNPVGFGEATRGGIWARLANGDSAHYAYHATMASWCAPNFWPGAYYPGEINLMEALGGAAAIVPEMLAQSHVNYAIQLLPAVPSAWPEGTVKGLRCRGGFTITEMAWDNGTLTAADIRSERGHTCRIYGTDYHITEGTDTPVAITETDGCLEFATTTGQTYRIAPGSVGIMDRGAPDKSSLSVHKNRVVFSTARDEPYLITVHGLQGRPARQWAVRGPVSKTFPLNLSNGFYLVTAQSASERIEYKSIHIGTAPDKH